MANRTILHLSKREGQGNEKRWVSCKAGQEVRALNPLKVLHMYVHSSEKIEPQLLLALMKTLMYKKRSTQASIGDWKNRNRKNTEQNYGIATKRKKL